MYSQIKIGKTYNITNQKELVINEASNLREWREAVKIHQPVLFENVFIVIVLNTSAIFDWCKLGTPSGRKVTWQRKEKKKAVNSGHYVLPATPMGSAHTLLGPIKAKL